MAKQEVTLVSGIGMTASTSRLAAILEENPARFDALKKNPKEELDKMALEVGTPAYLGDRLLYRWVAFALGLTILVSCVGAIYLAQSGKTIPEVLVALGSAAVGALAGLFAPTARKGT